MATSEQQRNEERPRGYAARFSRLDRPLTPVGELLELERQSRNWSYEEVARRAGISQSTWSTMIYGGRQEKNGFREIRVSARTVARYAVALGISVSKALKAAGYKSVPANVTYKLGVVPSEELWAELRRRSELTDTIEAELAARDAERHAEAQDQPR
jgi:transcriptional regulator with XRE-family HTH domain